MKRSKILLANEVREVPSLLEDFRASELKRVQFPLFIFILFTLLVGGVVLLFSNIFNFDFPDQCTNRLIEEKYSPDNSHKLFVFYRDCGATTKESIQIEIVNNDTKLTNNNVGNIFIMNSSSSIFVSWITN
jgi:hypothetical protein